jgi:MFS family permease
MNTIVALSVSRTFMFGLKKIPLRLALTLLVATLGYFVDVYDIQIFGGVRVPSLKDIGVPESELMDKGILLLNLQMIGMLLGGVLFGISGDKFGRTRMMFLSILTYSLATLANAFVQDVTSYAALRFISGFGLAGELGLGTTLVSELLSKEKRGLGVGLMVFFGLFGGLAAGFAAHALDWRTCYMIGGGMGLLLLFLRMGVSESGLFEKTATHVPRGDLVLLFKSKERAMRFFWCVMLGIPAWFNFGIMITFAKEIAGALQIALIATPILMIYFNAALSGGDLVSSLASQMFKNRRYVFMGFIGITAAAFAGFYIAPRPLDASGVIILYTLMSFGSGAWVLMAMVAAESFGTNLRATVATSVPNFARASVIPLTLGLTALKGHMPLQDAILVLGTVSFILPLIALWRLKETYGTSLDYIEE